MASSYDIVVDQGSDYSLPFKFKDAEGTVKDLTGCTARMQLRRTPQADAVADELTTENDRIEIDADAGTVTVIFPHAVTSALDAGRYAYDLELIEVPLATVRGLKGDAATIAVGSVTTGEPGTAASVTNSKYERSI